MMVYFVDLSTSMNNTRVFLVDQSCCKSYSEETIERLK